MPKLRIASLRDLDAAVAEHCMGWQWYRRSNPVTGQYWLDSQCAPPSPITGVAILTTHEKAQELGLKPEPFWNTLPAYSTDPAASYALRQKMREEGWVPILGSKNGQCLCFFDNGQMIGHDVHSVEHVAFALAALATKGITLDLVEGWDQIPSQG